MASPSPRTTPRIHLDCRVQPGEAAGPLPMVLDIGGEGRHPQAWNLNLSHVKTFGPGKGLPIPRLILGRAIPVADESVDLVIVERTPLTREALHEIARVVSRGGRIVLRHVPLPRRDRHALATSVLGRPPNRGTAYIGRQLVQETTFLLE